MGRSNSLSSQMLAQDSRQRPAAMLEGMRISRMGSGPYTYDELYDDYDYSSSCKCSPCKLLLFVLFLTAAIAVPLYFERPWENDGGSASSSSDNTPKAKDLLTALYERPTPLPVFQARTSPCNADNCKLPDCFCDGQTNAPRELSPAQTPQIVLLTFDNAVSTNNYNYFDNLFGFTNPNGCPATGTFFVTHEGTNYRVVQELYKRGHEIASASISHSRRGQWTEIDEMREILFRFGGIPPDQVRGFRAPFLEPGGDAMFEALSDNGFTYDSSLINHELGDPPVFPYTHEFPATMECLVGPCPEELSFPGLWEAPLTGWEDVEQTRKMGMADEYSPSSYDDALEYFRHNFKRHYETNRAPFNIYIHSWWFEQHPIAYAALLTFLRETMKLPDTWMLSHQQMLDWMREPRQAAASGAIPSWTCDSKPPGPAPCSEAEENVCFYKHPIDGKQVTLRSCTRCPDEYPWVGNPAGQEYGIF